MNAYLFWRAHQAFPNLGRYQILLALVVAALAAGPVLALFFGRSTRWSGMAWLAGPAYSWIAIVFWFFCLGVLLEVWNLGTKGAAAAGWATAGKLAVAPLPAFIAICSVVAMLTVASLLQARNIELDELTIKTPKLPAGSKPIRVLQISDVHLGGGDGRRRMARIFELVEQTKPDILVSTGDMIDGTAESLDEPAAKFAEMHPPLGKYAVNGNHEWYTGLRERIKFHDDAGFKLLMQGSTKVNDLLTIAGSEDSAKLGRRQYEANLDEGPMLDEARRLGGFILFLKHRPIVQASSLGRYDLQLSGHTHGGQIFPFNMVINLGYQYDRGFFDLGLTKLYVNRGTGTWGPPMRLGARPEVTLITIVPEAGE